MSTESLSKLHQLVNVATARGGLSSNLTTIGYLPEQRRLSINSYVPERKQVKFKKDRRLLRRGSKDMMDESQQKRWKPAIRLFDEHFLSTSREKRAPCKKGCGQFQDIGRPTLQVPMKISCRSLEDLGVHRSGLKRVRQEHSRDPILMNPHNPQTELRTQYKQTWRQARRLRDHGERISKLFTWDIQQRECGYAQLYKKKVGKS